MSGFDYSDAKSLLSGSKKVIITTHVSPDGDAIGSSLAMMHYLLKKGHDAVVITPDDYPSFLFWLPGNESAIRFDTREKEAMNHISEAELIFCLDFNSPDRMARLRPHIESAACPKILIDHHQEPEKWTDILYSDSSASSTSELVYRFIDGMGDRSYLDKDIGSCLYAGLITDTGSFKFPSTSSETLRIAADLMDLGVEASRIQNLIYDNSSEHRLRLMGYALTEKLLIIDEYNTAVMGLNADELKRFKYEAGDTEGLVNYPLSISSVKMSVFISEKSEEVRMSFRSKGNIPVHQIAKEHFNGGGHINAAGGVSDKSVEETVEYLRRILPNYKDFLC